jgi:hypothetical protein
MLEDTKLPGDYPFVMDKELTHYFLLNKVVVDAEYCFHSLNYIKDSLSFFQMIHTKMCSELYVRMLALKPSLNLNLT